MCYLSIYACAIYAHALAQPIEKKTPENGRHQGRAWASVKDAMTAGTGEEDSLAILAQSMPHYSPLENVSFTNTVVGRVLVKQTLLYYSFCLQTAVAELLETGLFSEVLRVSQVLSTRSIHK